MSWVHVQIPAKFSKTDEIWRSGCAEFGCPCDLCTLVSSSVSYSLTVLGHLSFFLTRSSLEGEEYRIIFMDPLDGSSVTLKMQSSKN